MQVSSGWAKGMKLAAPPGEATTRPTSAKVRAATLNVLAPYLEDALFLDIFAGSGAMGIEAVSRGARGAVFVEVARPPLASLKTNLAELERRAVAQELTPPRLEVVSADALAAMNRLSRHGKFSVVFLDPPYADAADWAAKLLGPLAALVEPGGVAAFESSTAAGPAVAAAAQPGWLVLKQKTYGDTMVTILEREQGDP